MVKPHSSIGLKITVLVLCGASLVFSLALAYSYSYSRRIILDEAEKSAKSLTLSVARRIEQEFRAAGKVPKASQVLRRGKGSGFLRSKLSPPKTWLKKRSSPFACNKGLANDRGLLVKQASFKPWSCKLCSPSTTPG